MYLRKYEFRGFTFHTIQHGAAREGAAGGHCLLGVIQTAKEKIKIMLKNAKKKWKKCQKNGEKKKK